MNTDADGLRALCKMRRAVVVESEQDGSGNVMQKSNRTCANVLSSPQPNGKPGEKWHMVVTCSAGGVRMSGANSR